MMKSMTMNLVKEVVAQVDLEGLKVEKDLVVLEVVEIEDGIVEDQDQK